MQVERSGRRSPLLLLLPVLVLGSCQYLYPEPDPKVEEQKKSDKPLFDDDPAYYAQNAKEYFHQGQYARAKTQWQNQLEIQPGDWMARLGLASCDYFLGSQALDLRDVRAARDLLSRAEAQARELWNGQIEADTHEALDNPSPQWKAALVLARTLRGLGDVDDIEARILENALRTMPASDPKRRQAEADRARLARQSAENRKASLGLFERLLAMKNPSEDAVLNAAELYVMADRIPEAEKLFLEYLAIAESTRKANAGIRETITANEAQDPDRARVAMSFLEEKLASNAAKQAAVLVRLGNIHFDRAEREMRNSEAPGLSEGERAAAVKLAHGHYLDSLQYLERAKDVSPARSDILVKMAQCQGRLGLFDAAVANLDQYIREAAERTDPFDDNLRLAYQLKSEYELKRAAARK